MAGRAAAAVLAVALACPAQAEPGPIGKWLMNQPVSLWDRGMGRAEAAAKETADFLARSFGDSDTSMELARSFKSGAERPAFLVEVYYNWDDNEITVQLNIFSFRFAALREPAPSDHQICNRARQDFLMFLLHRHLDPVAPIKKQLAKAAHKSVDIWFSHFGYREKSRDKELGAKLARIVFVRAYIQGTDRKGSKGITCRARITEWDAPSKPLSLR